MTIHGQHGKHHLHLYTVLVFTFLAVIFTTALTAAGLSGDQTGKHTFELRLASHEKVEGWERVPGPEPEKTFLWISPEVGLTNSDVEIARPSRAPGRRLCVAVFFTEEGALKMARLTKSHIGEFLAVILDGRVAMVLPIRAQISKEALIEGNYTDEELVSIAVWLSGGKIKFEPWKYKFPTGKIRFELRLASNEKVGGWEIGLLPEPWDNLVFISPTVALTNRDIARAYPDPNYTSRNNPWVGMMLTDEGALKMARLTKSHIGEFLAVIFNGQVVAFFKIAKEYTNGRALIPGGFTEEEAKSIAKGIMMK
jgi:preprotein translocase subunit SecD